MFGPIIDREMLTLARRRVCYGGRLAVPGLMLAIIWANLLGWKYFNGGPSTVQQTALFGRLTFAQLMVAQVVVTMQLVTSLVSHSLAEEKDRKTLTFLLSTPLSSVAIVLGKLTVGLIQYLSCLLAGLPVLLLLPLFGGVEPDLVLLCYIGTVSVALFVGAFSLAIAVVSRRSREAHRITTAMIAFWMFGPLVALAIVPRVVPGIWPWIAPLNSLVLASSPLSLLLTGGPFVNLGSLPYVGTRMVALQLGAAFVLLLFATLGLRPAWRRHEDSGAGVLARLAKRRPRRRRECGDRPVLWRELHAARARGGTWLVYRLLFLGMLALIVMSTYYAGRGAFAEVFASGYRVEEITSARSFFNTYVRSLTSALGLVYALTVTGIASEGIVVERMKETWLGLIATPLPGREIVQDKMMGAIWRARGLAVLIFGLWITGILAGSVHPLGVLAALVCLAVWSWFFAAIGTYGSLRSDTIASASNVSILPVLLLCMLGLAPRLLPESARSVLYGAVSMPFLEYLSLVSYREVYNIGPVWGSVTLDAIGLKTGEAHWRVVLTYALGLIAPAAGAVALSRLAYRQFDRFVGRPVRSAHPLVVESVGDSHSLEPVAAGSH